MTAPGQSTPLLLLEDNPSDALLVRELLDQTAPGRFNVVQADTLAGALDHLRQSDIQVMLADLNLPDSHGLNTVRSLRAAAADVALLILTGLDDDDTLLRALELGAHDYLQKSLLHPALILRAIRYAIERQRLLKCIDRAQCGPALLDGQSASERQQAVADELRAIERLTRQPATAIAAGFYGARSLSDSQPDIFHREVHVYRELLLRAMHSSIYKGDDFPSDPLRDMGYRLGRLMAGPRDVVEIHTFAMKDALQDLPVPKAKALIEEGRVLVLELMGYLATFYRLHQHFAVGKGRAS